ncbi:hypothetical protein DPMN_166622 [Dreissena polymorpha]|uniref:Transferrin-like domain-containing protein n=1 Tax=Dreissena polymorpha TaxID=45954 RepID=A0A9D4IY19_DREPO|nr:hypothetical protein DPMN_166622 [Dreissena polymorpha]
MVGNQPVTLARWCVSTDAAMQKCNEWVNAIKNVKELGPLAKDVRPAYKTNSNENDFSKMPVLSCVRADNVFHCMDMFDRNEVDLITLEAGQGYFAGRYHSMRPILAEKYDDTTDSPLEYYAVALKRTGGNVKLDQLKNKNACMPGIGTGAGWVYPIASMLKTRMIEVFECNAIVKTVTNFFNQMCLPGALNSFYNQFGNNPAKVCELCRGSGEEKCTSSDPHAGFDGALKCLNSGGDIAFVRHDTVSTNDPGNSGSYQLVCPDNIDRDIGDYTNCNFGKVPNDIVMTSGLKSDAYITAYKEFLLQASTWFGVRGAYKAQFSLFTSASVEYLDRKNVLFNDNTKMLVDVNDRDRYYTWIDKTFTENLLTLNLCPIDVVRLCVISDAERLKCERMVEVFRGKDIKPDMDCIMTKSSLECMKLLSTGDADLTMLDAGDIYKAGRTYNLVPIASEDYGDMTGRYKVVAAALKRNLRMTLYNLKDFRACHAGIGRGDGWIIPLNIYIETVQFIPAQCTIFENLGELFSRSCIPGALDKEYNPSGKPVNLCEACQGGGYRKCKRNSDELYYGTTGAFRCLTEHAGDVAFVHHLTVGDNTDGRNQAVWARNRRSDDYELLCKDGTRTHIENWANCYLGEVPGAALMTSEFVKPERRDIYWNIFSYGQQFFSSDIDGDYHMFDSGDFYSDLIFSDEAVRLIPVPLERQNYETYLGATFINQIRNLDQYQCVPVAGSGSFFPNLMLMLVSIVAFFVMMV